MKPEGKPSRRFHVNMETLQRCLAIDVGSSRDDMVCSDMSIEDVDRLQFNRSILKKFKGQRHEEASNRAIASFLSDNARGGDFELAPRSWFDDFVIGEVKTLLDKWLHNDDGCPATLKDLTDLGKCGPGSSIDVDLPTFYTKLFDSTLATANPALRRLYGAAVSSNPSWARAEECRESTHGNRTVLGSKLSTVPKQFDIDRTIATEPPLEMFFQLGIGGFLETDVLKPLGINLSTQPDKNREMARIGSIDGDSCTIDLKSASNNIYLALKPIFPRYFWDWLMRCRSPYTRLPNGEWVRLNMIASMGNGFCFPLQTMLFASIVCAVYRLMNIEPNFGSASETGFLSRLRGFHGVNCGVFGDDIVVRRDAYHSVIRALELFGFQVNQDKSFSTGNFRESCGHDYVNGVNVRGVYLKTLSSRQDCFSLINRLMRWSVKTGITLDYTLSFLLRTIGFVPIPYVESDDRGVKVPSTWWRPQYYSLTQGYLYECVCLRARKLLAPTSLDDRRAHPDLGFNANGLLVSFVGGYIKDGYISIRDDTDDVGDKLTTPEVRLLEVPSWDYIPTASRLFDLRGNSWEAYAERVLAIAYPFRAGLA